MSELASPDHAPSTTAGHGDPFPMPQDALNDNEPRGLVIAVFERHDDPGVWTVEVIDEGSEGEVYQALFVGPNAERRCREYADWAYGV